MSEKSDNEIIGASITTLLAVALAAVIAAACIVEGLVVVILWRWFVVATFGLPELRIPIAIGLCLIATLACKPVCRPTKPGLGAMMSAAFIRPLLLLVIGWIVHLFI